MTRASEYIRDNGHGFAGLRIESSNLRDQALRAIRAGILAGGLRPGVLYSNRSVAQELGVSATPIREAMLELAMEGLVEVVRGRGFRVRIPTERDLDQIMELRRMIEVPAVTAITERRLLTDTRELRALGLASESCAAAGDWRGCFENDRDFHMGLFACLGNAWLLRVVGTLRDQSRLYGLHRVPATDDLLPSAHGHQVLVDAVADGRADEAARIMDARLRQARNVRTRETISTALDGRGVVRG